MADMEAGAIHPLTGPVFVKGAQPGDVLEVEFLDIIQA
jgi:formamidase